MAEQADPGATLPEAVVAERRRGISMSWLIPVVAGVIAVWLALTTIAEQGPTITIKFETAEGLEAGKTKLKYRDVEVGIVDSISIAESGKHIVVAASIESHSESYLKEGTRFWVVKPRLDASGVSGLGTLVSGAFIELEPGTGEAQLSFTGLETPPVLILDVPGRKFILQADRRGSLGPRSPIYYRGIKAGEILGSELAKDKRSVQIHAFVKAPFDELVREHTRFWNVSGIEISTGADGFKIKTESLQALLAGGITFETADGASGGRPAAEGATFTLFDSREVSREVEITEKIPYLLYFSGSVRGLSPDAPVEFRGVRVGTVDDIRFQLDRDRDTVRIAVVINIEPQRIVNFEETQSAPRTDRYETVAALVERGLRAQMRTGSLITGQQIIVLDLYPDKPKKKLRFGGLYPEIPTIPSTLTEITDTATRILTKFEQLPLDVIVKDMHTALTSLDSTLKEVRALAKNVNSEAGPLLREVRQTAQRAQSTMVKADAALTSIDSLVAPGSDVRQDLDTMLRELAGAARSIRLLMEELERNPESLLRGKGGQ